MRHRSLTLLLTLIMLISLAGSTLPVQPTAASTPDPNTAQDYVVARVYFSDQADLDSLAASLDVWEVDHQLGYLLAMLSSDEYASLQQAGYRLEIDQEHTNLLYQPLIPLPGQGPDSIPGYPCYRLVSETYDSMTVLNTMHPELVELYDIGDSWDKVTPGGADGYDLYALRLTNESIPGDKPTFFLMAEIHAREYVTAETAMRFAEYLVNNYGIDPDITWLLDYFQVYVVPMTNPDGRIYAEGGQLWRKNTHTGCASPNSRGVDLNRNHSFQWGGASNDPCSLTYQGTSPASEPETQAIQSLVLSLFPDQRGGGISDPAPDDATGTFITLHSYSELVLFPWGWSPNPPPNNADLETLGRKFGFFNNYQVCQSGEPGCIYATTGTSDDWAYGELGIASYTYEMGTQFFQSCSSFESTIYPNNLPALIYALKAARRPYQNPAGPDSLTLVVTPNTVPAGTPVDLTAVADDTRYDSNGWGSEPTQPIAAARYSIDNPSWITGTVTYPMTASDGSFNSTIEGIQATIDTTALTPGQHTIFVESQDNAGNWGVTSAVFLDISAPSYNVSLTPENSSGVAAPGQVYTHTLTVNNTGSSADSYTVTVSSLWAYSAPAVVGPVTGGSSTSLEVAVTVPPDANLGDFDTAVVTVTSQGNPVISDSAQLTTTADVIYALQAEAEDASLEAHASGTTVVYTVHITNTGNVSDSYTLQVSSSWQVDFTSPVGPVAAGSAATVTFTVHVPAGVRSGELDVATVTITSLGNPSATAQLTLTTTTLWNSMFVPFLAKQ